MGGNTRTIAVLVGLVLLGQGPARAGAPQIANVSPSGLQRGHAGEVTFSGANLAGNPRLIAPFPFRVEPVDPKRNGARSWTARLTIAPEVAVGVYPIRVQTEDGLSNPFLMAVGQLPQVEEKEDNSAFEAAQSLPAPPLVVEGQAAGNDVDYFKFAGKKGQLLVVDAQCARIGSGVDPSIRLTTAGSTRRFVASADDSPGLLTDARLIAELPEDADYVVEISDSKYQGAGRPVYRLLIGAVPVAGEIYPLGGREGETLGLELRGGTLGATRVAAVSLPIRPETSLYPPRISSPMLGLSTSGPAGLDVESLQPLNTDTMAELREPADPASSPVRAASPIVFNGRIDPAGDEDRFVVSVSAGQRLHVSVSAARLGSALDAVLQVQGAKGAVIANADDTTIEVPGQAAGQGGLVFPDPSLDLTVPGGTDEIALVVRDLEGRGGVGFPYRIVVTPIVPSFEVHPNAPQLSIPRGGSAGVGVTVKRQDYAGPIALDVADPPAGLVIRPGAMAPGQDVGALSISASPTASFTAVPLRLVGRAKGPGGPIEVEATTTLVFAQQSILPTNTLTQRGLPAAPALPTPVTLEAPTEPIEVAHGYGASIPIKANRTKGADAALAVTALPLPPGLAVPAASVAEKAVQAAVAVNTALEAPLGPVTIVLQAKGKFASGEQTISVPAVTLNLVRPAEVTLGAAAVEVKPGATVEVKGKVSRKGAFKEPVMVRINGLPAGLKADPVTVPPAAAEFAIKVVADGKAAPTSAVAKLVSAYQVSKKDYPTTAIPLAVKIVPAG